MSSSFTSLNLSSDGLIFEEFAFSMILKSSNWFVVVSSNSNSSVDNKIPKLGHRNSKNYQTYLELIYSRRLFWGWLKVLQLDRFFLPRPHVLEHNSAMKSIKTVHVCQIYLLFIVSQWNITLRYHFVYFLNISFIVNETNNLSMKWSKGTSLHMIF